MEVAQTLNAFKGLETIFLVRLLVFFYLNPSRNCNEKPDETCALDRHARACKTTLIGSSVMPQKTIAVQPRRRGFRWWISTNLRIASSVRRFAGVDARNVELTLNGGILTLTGERASQEVSSKAGDEVQALRVERGHGRFHRRFVLPDTVDGDCVNAAGKNGVLIVTDSLK